MNETKANVDQPFRLSARTRLRLMRLRARRRFDSVFRPWRLHPEELSGYDGEPPHFLRYDLARTVDQVVAYFRESWGSEPTDYLDVASIDTVWMVPHVPVCTDPDCESDDHEHHTEDECWYDVVEEGTPKAIRYWRWSE